MTILFEMVKEGGGMRVAQEDADHVLIELLIEGTNNQLRLTTIQAVALAIALCASNPGHVMHQAEQLDDETSAVLGQAFLLPSARRALERKAAESEAVPWN